MTKAAHRPRLVLVHGLGSSSAIWRTVLPGLARVVEPLLVDLPGHGGEPWDGRPLSPAELSAHVGRAMDAHGWERAHLLGHSLGGWTVLEAAADGPGVVGDRTRPGRPVVGHRPGSEPPGPGQPASPRGRWRRSRRTPSGCARSAPSRWPRVR